MKLLHSLLDFLHIMTNNNCLALDAITTESQTQICNNLCTGNIIEYLPQSAKTNVGSQCLIQCYASGTMCGLGTRTGLIGNLGGSASGSRFCCLSNIIK